MLNGRDGELEHLSHCLIRVSDNSVLIVKRLEDIGDVRRLGQRLDIAGG